MSSGTTSSAVKKEPTTRWYYQKKELRNTPSTTAGLDPMVEARYRREGARFIMELGTSMNLSLQNTLATAVTFFHRFYMCHSFQEFPRYPVGCACLFLAGKVEETPKKCKDMIEMARKQIPEPKFSAQFGADDRSRLEEVMTLERIILQTIKFDLQLEHPYKFLVSYATRLRGDKNRLQKMVQMTWNFVNDSLCTTLCLQWEPEIIAIALMYLACKLNKFDVEDWNGRESEHLRWWDMYVQDMTIEVLEDICHQVLDFYAQAQAQAQADAIIAEIETNKDNVVMVAELKKRLAAVQATLNASWKGGRHAAALPPSSQPQQPPQVQPPISKGPNPPPTTSYQHQAAAYVFAHVLHQQQQQQHMAGAPPPVPQPHYPPPAPQNYYPRHQPPLPPTPQGPPPPNHAPPPPHHQGPPHPQGPPPPTHLGKRHHPHPVNHQPAFPHPPPPLPMDNHHQPPPLPPHHPPLPK